MTLSCVIDEHEPRALFIESLPASVREKILWYCDYEDSSFRKWIDASTGNEYSGCGIFITDEQNTEYGTESYAVYSSSFAAHTTIKQAVTPCSPKAVRLMHWTDKAWNEDGQYFPAEAYYSTFMMLPHIYGPKKPANNDPCGDGGWWNIFQFKSDNNAGSHPVVQLDIYVKSGKMCLGKMCLGKMCLALITKDFPEDNSSTHTQVYHKQTSPMEVFPNTWVHIEVFYKKTKTYTGIVTV